MTSWNTSYGPSSENCPWLPFPFNPALVRQKRVTTLRLQQRFFSCSMKSRYGTILLYFCSSELYWRSIECVPLFYFYAFADIFAVIKCSVLALSAVFCSGWRADMVFHNSDTLYDNQQGDCLWNIMHIVWTTFAKTLVCKRKYEIIFWRHKQRIASNNDHYTPLIKTRIW